MSPGGAGSALALRLRFGLGAEACERGWLCLPASGMRSTWAQVSGLCHLPMPQPPGLAAAAFFQVLTLCLTLCFIIRNTYLGFLPVPLMGLLKP